ncbi:MAG: alpha/beta fold hydrolase [Pseudomonadota bacterium]
MFALLASLALSHLGVSAQAISQAVIEDPRPDAMHPARMAVIHVPTGGVEINGIVYIASGLGPHPTFVLFHGVPGNEKNLDLAQAVRRAGWNAVMVNYRGSWGSPGKFSFAQNLEDAKATLAFIRNPVNAVKLDIDPNRIALGGHSMGGWVSALTASQDPALLGTVIISAADMGAFGQKAKEHFSDVAGFLEGGRPALAGVSGQAMADELRTNADGWTLVAAAPRLRNTNLYVLYSADDWEADSVRLIKAIEERGGASLRYLRVPTDHVWSDKRLTLASLVTTWLESLKATKP